MEIISKADAISAGLTHYFTGKPCKHGHLSVRFTRDSVCRECGNRYRTEKYARNPAHHIAKVIEWRKSNREKHNAIRSRRQRERFANDPRFAMELRVRGAINDALRLNGFTKRSKASQILGCSWPEFVTHIERQFVPGMSWANRALWHLDHIVPIASAKTEADVIALSHFTNLRPLWIPENMEKRDKVLFLL
jgi:hypothetical protein